MYSVGSNQDFVTIDVEYCRYIIRNDLKEGGEVIDVIGHNDRCFEKQGGKPIGLLHMDGGTDLQKVEKHASVWGRGNAQYHGI